MDVSPTTAPDWVMNLIRDFQDKITQGLYEGVYDLEGRPLERLMERQAHACGAAYLELCGLPEGMGLEEFLSRIRYTGPSQIDIHRADDTIDWVERHPDGCVCPLVKRNVIRLERKLCLCGAAWVRYLFEKVANTCVDVEIVDTIASGAQNCHFRVRLLDAGS